MVASQERSKGSQRMGVRCKLVLGRGIILFQPAFCQAVVTKKFPNLLKRKSILLLEGISVDSAESPVLAQAAKSTGRIVTSHPCKLAHESDNMARSHKSAVDA